MDFQILQMYYSGNDAIGKLEESMDMKLEEVGRSLEKTLTKRVDEKLDEVMMKQNKTCAESEKYVSPGSNMQVPPIVQPAQISAPS